MNVRYSGTAPHEQIGSGIPNSTPRSACEKVVPLRSQATDARGIRPCTNPDIT